MTSSTSEQLARDVERFKRAGGRIEHLAPGVVSQPVLKADIAAAAAGKRGRKSQGKRG